MSTIVEEFKDSKERDARITQLREGGHHISIHSDTVPVKWESRFYLTYSPEHMSFKERRRVARVKAGKRR